MTALRFVLWRVVQLIPVLIGISIVAFLLVKLSPGDPVRLMLGPRATDEAIAAVRERYGLERPLVEQYFVYMRNVVEGDLGRSIRFRVPVLDLIGEYLPRTLFLIAYVLALSIPAAVLLAIVAARQRDGWADRALRGASLLGMTIPAPSQTPRPVGCRMAELGAISASAASAMNDRPIS